jgi:AbrB family looped-hinge helix DNA binding protein
MYVKAKVTSKHQITLPKSIRERLGIEKGDEVIFEGEGDRILVRVEKKADPVKALEGLLEEEDLEELQKKAASRLLKKKLGLA